MMIIMMMVMMMMMHIIIFFYSPFSSEQHCLLELLPTRRAKHVLPFPKSLDKDSSIEALIDKEYSISLRKSIML